MAIDAPAKIAVLGAGPIGLEAALYARFLGYQVSLFERGEVAENVTCWGHARMFSPFRMNRSNLGIAALVAHDSGYRAPADDALLTGHQWVEQYLLPLSRTDLLSDSLRLQNQVLAVGRQTALKLQLDPSRASEPFRILYRDRHGAEETESVDAVIDATGVYGNPNPIGTGGIPAVGESASRPHIDYELPDVLGNDRSRFEGRRTLVVGSGYSAATTVVALCQLAEDSPSTYVTWVTRQSLPPGSDGPMRPIENDRLPERAVLSEAANGCISTGLSNVEHYSGTTVLAVQWDQDAEVFRVELTGETAGHREFDRVVCHTGFRPDIALCRELHVHQCYATEGPIKLAAALLGQASSDCLDQKCDDVEALVCPESDFYVLGAKSYARNPHFLFSSGLQQIRSVFGRIGDRPDLDLYSSIQHLVS